MPDRRTPSSLASPRCLRWQLLRGAAVLGLLLSLSLVAPVGVPAADGNEPPLLVEKLEAQAKRLADELKQLEREAREQGGAWKQSAKEEWEQRHERLARMQAEAEALARRAKEEAEGPWARIQSHLAQSWAQVRAYLRKLLED